MKYKIKAAIPFIVYLIKDHRSQEVFYVGYSRRGTERPRETMRLFRIPPEFRDSCFEILEFAQSPLEARTKEKYWIAKLFREGCPLVNIKSCIGPKVSKAENRY